MRLLYLVHDLRDAAVQRRRRFLVEGGASVSTVGFSRRNDAAFRTMEGLAIGQTQDGRLLRRIASTLRAALLPGRWLDQIHSADVVIARSLEMLLIAVVVRKRAGLTTPIAYECLDIHRLMTRSDAVGSLLRGLEAWLLRSCSLLIVSSPQFIEAYFERYHRSLPRWVLLENKLLQSELGSELPDRRRPTTADVPVWRIGWFGIIRCRRSLSLLADLVRASNGAVAVTIRGRPALDVIPDFVSIVASTPGLTFGGPYDRATDLSTIYGDVHFNWAIDFYEAALNSAWLLPNRLYEGSMFGAVPLASSNVETGRWLERHGCGLLLDDPLEQSLPTVLATMTASSYQDAQQRVAAIDPTCLMETFETATAFVTMLGGLRTRNPASRSIATEPRPA